MVTSQPSVTNCPRLFGQYDLLIWVLVVVYVQCALLLSQCVLHKGYSGDYSTGVPPLPIPNREVKPGHADGTA